MKIVQLVPRLDSGGVERGIVEVSQALVEAGHESIVISAGGRMVESLEKTGSRHVSMNVTRKSPFTLASVAKLRKWLNDEQPDVIHPRSRLPAWLCWFATKQLKANHSRLVTSVHGLHSVNRYSAVVTRGLRIEVVSDTVRKYVLANYANVGKTRIRLIYRGIDELRYCRGFSPSEKWLAEWNSAGVTDTRPTLVLPGRLSRLKGHDSLFEIVKELDARNIQVNALVVGGTEPGRERYENEIRRKVDSHSVLRKSVHFLGHRTDLREIMSMCDIVLSLSVKPEAFGRTVLEALSLGKPVVGFNHGGVGEILSALFPNGAVPVGDIQSSASAIATVLATPHTIAAHDWTLKTMCEATLKMYEELA